MQIGRAGFGGIGSGVMPFLLQPREAGTGRRLTKLDCTLVIITQGKAGKTQGGDLRAIRPRRSQADAALVKQNEITVPHPGIISQKTPPIADPISIDPVTVTRPTGEI